MRERVYDVRDISIHALRKESDYYFLLAFRIPVISIHALRKESDPDSRRWLDTCCYFNPRSP